LRSWKSQEELTEWTITVIEEKITAKKL